MKKIAVSLITIFLLLCFIPSGSADKPAGSYDVMLVIDNSVSLDSIDTYSITSFINSTDNKNRLGIISFGSGAKVLQKPLPMSDGNKKKAISVIKDLKFNESWTEIDEGLKSAYLTLKGSNNLKMVTLLSDGKIDSPDFTREEEISRLEKKIVPLLNKNKIAVYPISYGDANLSIMQTIARQTGGRMIAAPNNMALSDSFSLINTISKPAEAEPVTRTSSNAFLIIIIAVIMAFIISAAGFLLFANRKFISQLIRPKDDDVKHSEFPNLRKSVKKLDKLMNEAKVSLEGFKSELEDYGAEGWSRENTAIEGYKNITNRLFHLLDELSLEPEKHLSACQRIRQIIKEEGIVEIPASEGDLLNDRFHKKVAENYSKLPAGRILETLKSGYYKKNGSTVSEIVLRPAEVIVSNGHEGEQLELMQPVSNSEQSNFHSERT